MVREHRKRIDHRSRALLIAGLLLVAITADPRRVSATAPCGDSAVVNRFDGIDESPSSSAYAARATITERSVYLCSTTLGQTSAGAAFTMLAASDARGYAQIGYVRIAGYAAQRFYEFWDGDSGGSWARGYFGLISPGTSHSNHVVYSFTDGKVRMIFDGVTKQTTPFSIESGQWATPWEGQWLGETWDRGDDVPGTASAKVRFSQVGVVTVRDGGYVKARNPQLHTGLPVYKFTWITVPTSFDIWTQR